MDITKLTNAVIGGVIGGIVGYLVGDWIAYKVDENNLEEKWGEVLAEYQAEESSKEDWAQTSSIDTEALGKTDNVAYAKITTDDKPSLEELIKERDGVETNPYFITTKEWSEVSPEDRFTYMYYALDDTFCDENEEIITNRGDIFPPNVVRAFGDTEDDPDVLYVHNPARGEMYEIILLQESYKVQVMGEIEGEEPQKPVKQPRKKTPPKRKKTITPEE